VDESIIQTWGGQKAVYRSKPLEKNAFLKSLDEEEEQGGELSGMEVEDQGGAREADLAKVAGLEENVQYWTDYLKVCAEGCFPSSIWSEGRLFYSSSLAKPV
jgi:hypothetical protein